MPWQRLAIDLGGAEIQFVQLREEKLFGFGQIHYHDVPLQVSDREKTILDCQRDAQRLVAEARRRKLAESAG